MTSKLHSKPINGKYMYMYEGKYTVLEAAKIASTSRAKQETILLIDNGTMYVNTGEDANEHAEMVMMKDNQLSDISKIYIRNTPCYDCSTEMITFYKKRKPTIYIGKIWKGNSEKNDEGLMKLIKSGFTLRGWREYKYIYMSSNHDKDSDNEDNTLVKGKELEDHLAELKEWSIKEMQKEMQDEIGKKERRIKEMQEEIDRLKSTPTTN